MGLAMSRAGSRMRLRGSVGSWPQVADLRTARRLEHLGVAPDWRRLDVGAGAGSAARWLAAKVGPAGRVVATDIAPRFLGEINGEVNLPNLEVRRRDMAAEDSETAHDDLVHGRVVLMHLAPPERPLQRMAAAVRPGGWLCLEERHWPSFGAADPAHPAAAAFDRRSRAVIGALNMAGMAYVSFGRRVRPLIEQLGFAEVGYEGVTGARRGA